MTARVADPPNDRVRRAWEQPGWGWPGEDELRSGLAGIDRVLANGPG